MIPFPHQVEGSKFLADRAFAILGDEPRVGKTGTAIMAADTVGAKSILVVTTASGRGVWRRAFDDWSIMGRDVAVMTDPKIKPAAVTIIGWPTITRADYRLPLLQREWDVLILDESHYGKSFDAARTRAVFGELDDDGAALLRRQALTQRAKRVWCLTGTPLPNSPFDLYPALRAGAAGRLLADAEKGWPNVTLQGGFKARYCQVKPKKIGHGYMARWIDVIVGGKNLDELRQRCEGLILRRTQQDVGIRAPIYETMPLVLDRAARPERHELAKADAKRAEIMAAIEAGGTRDLEIHLGPLRRITGALKAEAIVGAIKDEFESGLDRVVLAYWHKEVAEKLIAGLSEFGVVGIDGSTPPAKRDANVAAFQSGKARVFLGQIQAAAEAIDLSSSAELIFVENSFIPKDMKQMSLRVTNHTQTRQVRVRVATLEGSIDDAIQSSLLRKWSAINEVLTNDEN